MNRLKIALYTAVVVVLCAVNAIVVPHSWVTRELSRLDSQLQNASVDLSSRAARTSANEALDAGSVAAVRSNYGVDVTVVENGKPPRSPLPPADAARAVKVAPPSGRAVGVGELSTPPSPGLPALPLLFESAPAYRVRTAGIPSGPVTVLSAATAPVLAPVVAYQWIAFLATLVLLALGLLAIFTVTNEASPVVPKALVGVADRLARGDFSARAPSFAGSLGILAAGMNSAADAAESAARAPAPAVAADDPFASASGESPEPPPPAPEPEAAPELPASGADFADAFGTSLPPSEPPVEPPGASTMNLPAAARGPDHASPLGAIASEPSPEPVGEAAQPFFSPPASEPASAHQTTAMPLTLDPPDAAAPAAEPRSADEEHWRAVYDDFVRVRTQCGEPAAVPYERFRQKLEKNRDQLVSKYACRTVRFQVYVKEGKAALKASPVR